MEMEDHGQKLNREAENLKLTFQKDLDKLKIKHTQDLDKKVNLERQIEYGKFIFCHTLFDYF